MGLENIIRLLAGVFLLLANAFFVATEFALTRLRQYSPSEIKGSKGLDRAWEMTERLEIYLTSCQIGITSTSILLGVVAEPAVTVLIEQLFYATQLDPVTSHSISIVISVVLINFVHTVWGEQAPTYFGVERAKTVSRYCASPLYWWTMSIYPILYVGDWLTKGTLRIFGITIERSWVEETEQESPSRVDMKGEISQILRSGDVSKDRRDEVVRALEIDEIPVSEIMVPRDEIISLSQRKSLDENLEIMRARKSRYPLVGESIDDFKGVVYASEMLSEIERIRSGELSVADIGREGMTVSPDLPVSELIDDFQKNNQELALVVRNGEVRGLATITDALEAIVGSAEDPMDIEHDNNEGGNST